MTLATRTILILTLMVTITGTLPAQQTTSTSGTSAETSTAPAELTTAPATEMSSDEIRNQFSNLLRQTPYEVATILALDPALISNEEFLAVYPQLARFVEQHPEIRHNPRFYLADFAHRRGEKGALEDSFESLIILGIFTLIAFALAWFVRTVIEQKRWNRLAQTQSEVHNKILDRFGSSEEVLAYIKTPAGTRFLESAPIPLHTERPTSNPPLTRVILSIQAGVIVAAAALGMLLVSGRFEGESGQSLFAMGMIAFCIGGGFIVSAGVSLFLTRRLGLWQGPSSLESTSIDRLDEAGRVR
jgi:hypothetical protein